MVPYQPPPGAKSYTLAWACPIAPPDASGKALPERKMFTVYYTDQPQVVDLTEIRSFLRKAESAGELNYSECADSFYMIALRTSYGLCEKNEKAAGKNDDAVKAACMKEKPGDIHEEIAKAVKRIEDSSKKTARRPPFLPMSPMPKPPLMQDAEKSRITSNLIKSFTEKCERLSFEDPGSTPGMVKAVSFSKEFIEGTLAHDILPKVSDSCRERIVGSYLDDLAYLQIPPKLCSADPVPDACKQVRDATTRAVVALQGALPPGKLKEVLSYSGNLESCLRDADEPETLLRGMILDTKYISSCVELDNGESSTVDEMDYSQAGTAASYKLSREGASYKAQVNIDFKPETSKALIGRMRAKASLCLKQSSAMMKGPGGQSLEVSIYDPSAAENKKDAKPPHACKVDITSAQEQQKIDSESAKKGESGFRENSGNWSEKTPCDVITHEVLHLLGLVDEYPESEIGYVYDDETGDYTKWTDKNAAYIGFDCRSLGPSDSIMYDSSEAYKSYKAGRRTSILMPAHFAAITHPGCVAKNHLYMQCASAAYSTSVEHKGEGCPSGLPASCKDPDQWLKGPANP